MTNLVGGSPFCGVGVLAFGRAPPILASACFTRLAAGARDSGRGVSVPHRWASMLQPNMVCMCHSCSGATPAQVLERGESLPCERDHQGRLSLDSATDWGLDTGCWWPWSCSNVRVKCKLFGSALDRGLSRLGEESRLVESGGCMGVKLGDWTVEWGGAGGARGKRAGKVGNGDDTDTFPLNEELDGPASDLIPHTLRMTEKKRQRKKRKKQSK